MPRTENCARTMIVVTDGYIAAEREVFGLISENLSQCNVFTFGIGSSVNRFLIEGMAKAGQGEPFVVTKPEAAASAATRFKTYVQSPVLTGVSVDFNGFDAYDVEPAVQADLFAQRPLVICGKWRGQPQGSVRLRGAAAAGPYDRSFTVTNDMLSATNIVLPYLWARTRLSHLTDFSPRQVDDDTRNQVIQLGLNYRLLTRYTSFVAVHETVRNTTAAARDVAQPLPLPLNVSNYAVGGRNAPEPEISAMPALMCLVVLAVLWRRRRHGAV